MTFYYFYGGIAFSYFTFHFECFPQCTHTLQLHKEVYMSALCARKARTVGIHHPRAPHVLLHSLAVVPTTHALSCTVIGTVICQCDGLIFLSGGMFELGVGGAQQRTACTCRSRYMILIKLYVYFMFILFSSNNPKSFVFGICTDNWETNISHTCRRGVG